MSDEGTKARAEFEETDHQILLKVGGAWRLTEALPPLDEKLPREASHRAIRVVPEDLTEWDSSLPVFLLRVRSWCRKQEADLKLDELPKQLRRLFDLISESEERALSKRPEVEEHPLRKAVRHIASNWRDFFRFIGDCAIGTARLSSPKYHFSWRDWFQEMVEAGPKALPIIGLLSFLIGMTFGYEVAGQLRHFGAQIWVINGVGVAVVRQTGPMIAAVVLAGRTGAAFAGHLANMKVGGEIDALEILGVSPINFLVLPRVVALMLMMPMITLYSNMLGLLGSMAVTVPMLNIPVSDYWTTLEHAVTLSDVLVGLLKSVVFGLSIALAGTLRGLQSERSSVGVGRAVTSAVVTGIAAVVMADALFAPIINHLGL